MQSEYFSLQGQEDHLRLQKSPRYPQGMDELTVFYCESCTNFLSFCGMDDEGYFNALTGMFAQALRPSANSIPISGSLFRTALNACDAKGTTMAIGSGRPWTT